MLLITVVVDNAEGWRVAGQTTVQSTTVINRVLRPVDLDDVTEFRETLRRPASRARRHR